VGKIVTGFLGFLHRQQGQRKAVTHSVTRRYEMAEISITQQVFKIWTLTPGMLKPFFKQNL